MIHCYFVKLVRYETLDDVTNLIFFLRFNLETIYKRKIAMYKLELGT